VLPQMLQAATLAPSAWNAVHPYLFFVGSGTNGL
jgi:hypothetical protein